MLRLSLLTLWFISFNTICLAYIDPVTTSIVYQILFFLITGTLVFFTKLKKIIRLINKEYKHSDISLYIVSFFPTWILLSDLNQKEIFIILIIFFLIPLTITYLLKFFFKHYDKDRFYIFLNSFVIIYGLDQSLGLASVINFLRIFDDIIRYSAYGLLFTLLLTCCYLLYLKNNKIINLFIVIIFFSTAFNLVKNEKNIKNLKNYEVIKNDISDVKIEKVNSNIKPTIIIILDEMNGYSGLNNDIINTQKTKENTDSLFQKFGFTHYPNAYSIYGSTADAVPSYLNFHYEYDYKKMDNYRKAHNDSFGFYQKLTSNKLFDLFEPSKIYVHQTLGLDFCAYENFKECKTLNPFSKKNKYIDNFYLNNYDYIFSQFAFQTSIFATLLTRILRHYDLIKIIEPRLIGKVTIKSTLDELFIKSATKKYSLLMLHILAPHKPFAWEKNSCNYKYYKNPNFISDKKLQEFHNIEIQCINKYLGDFFNKLSENNLLNYYNIIIASDHGARNLDLTEHSEDWYSTLYAERIIGGKYKKVNDIMSGQLLFSNFFNKDNERNSENMFYNHTLSSYELLSD